MKPTIEKWMQFAQADMETAIYLLKKPNANQWTYLLSVWHGHQAVEKILKAIIINKNKELLRIHDLIKLFKMSECEGAIDEQQKNFLFELNQYYITTRYPDLPLKKSYPKATKTEAENIIKNTKKIFLCLKKELLGN